MQLLLDTVTFLWFVAGSRDLSRKAKDALRVPANDVCQALSERLTLVTPDEAVRAYPAPTLW